MCVLTNERYKTYQKGFSFCPLGHAPGVGLWGAGGAQGGQKIFFFKHGHVVYQIDGDEEQNRMQVKVSSQGQTGDLGVRSKVKYHEISVTIFLYKILCVFSQMKDTKHIRRDFYSVAWVMPQGWDFGALGVPRGSKIFFSNMVL